MALWSEEVLLMQSLRGGKTNGGLKDAAEVVGSKIKSRGASEAFLVTQLMTLHTSRWLQMVEILKRLKSPHKKS